MYNNEYINNINTLMNEYLANINVLSVKVKNLHYNVVGYEFFEIHELLDTYYSSISSEIDAVAERIRILDSFPDACLKLYLEKSKIKELESKAYKYSVVVQYLIDDFKFMVSLSHNIITISGDANDAGTADLFTRTIQFYEKNLWMLKALITS